MVCAYVYAGAYGYACTCMHTQACVLGDFGCYRWLSDSLELELQVIMGLLTWVLRTSVGPFKESRINH